MKRVDRVIENMKTLHAAQQQETLRGQEKNRAYALACTIGSALGMAYGEVESLLGKGTSLEWLETEEAQGHLAKMELMQRVLSKMETLKIGIRSVAEGRESVLEKGERTLWEAIKTESGLSDAKREATPEGKRLSDEGLLRQAQAGFQQKLQQLAG